MTKLNEILIIDDEKDICEQISGLLNDKGFETKSMISSEEAINSFKKKDYSLVILDIWLNNSKLDGFQTLEKILEINGNVPVIMISGHGNIETAVNSIKKGAYDFIEKPFDGELLIFKVKKALENYDLKSRINNIYKNKAYNYIAKSDCSKNTVARLKKIIKTESFVFLNGDRGSGKEFLAKKLHSESNRFFKNFKTVDLALLEENHVEEEFFGKEEKQILKKTGVFEEVNGGTLLFKNIDQLSSKNQGKLVRVFEEKKYRRIGGGSFKTIDFRVICSSDFSLEYLKKKKILRDDLVKNLNFYEIYVPALSERFQDKFDLINVFINEIVTQKNISIKNISKDFLSFVMDIECFKNTLQLKKFLEWSLSVLCDINKDQITRENLVKLMLNFIGGKNLIGETDFLNQNLKNAREIFEKKYLEYNLDKFNMNISKMSKQIGMERTALYRKLKSLNIKTE